MAVGLPSPVVSAAATGAGSEARDAPAVSIVLPCLDEVESVGSCVKEALDATSAAGLTAEVVVVDNGSVDGSAEAARSAGARVVHEAIPGYGSALRAGFAEALGEVVVMADADFTYDLTRVPELVAPVLAGTADMVLGSRLDAATRATMPILHRMVGTPVITFLVARACGGRVVRDSQSGFRAFRRASVERLGLRSTGMELASEMLVLAARSGLRIEEIDTGYRPRIGESKLNTFADGWRHLQLIFLLAPDVLLVGPGALLFAVGCVLSVAGLVAPSGVEVGSFRWQPVFFSSIALVLGAQALLAGTVLAYRSSVTSQGVRRRFAFVGRPGLPATCVAVGVAMLLAGLAVDLALFLRWVEGSEPSPPSLGFASLAQSLLILGGTLASFGVIARFLVRRDTREGTD